MSCHVGICTLCNGPNPPSPHHLTSSIIHPRYPTPTPPSISLPYPLPLAALSLPPARPAQLSSADAACLLHVVVYLECNSTDQKKRKKSLLTRAPHSPLSLSPLARSLAPLLSWHARRVGRSRLAVGWPFTTETGWDKPCAPRSSPLPAIPSHATHHSHTGTTCLRAEPEASQLPLICCSLTRPKLSERAHIGRETHRSDPGRRPSRCASISPGPARSQVSKAITMPPTTVAAHYTTRQPFLLSPFCRPARFVSLGLLPSAPLRLCVTVAISRASSPSAWPPAAPNASEPRRHDGTGTTRPRASSEHARVRSKAGPPCLTDRLTD